jgi:hypothetical protein
MTLRIEPENRTRKMRRMKELQGGPTGASKDWRKNEKGSRGKKSP